MNEVSTTAVADTSATVTTIAPRLNPDVVEIEGLHLSIKQRWASGSTHNIHMLENGDINVILARGQAEVQPGQVIQNEYAIGTVIVALGVDDDHDEVHFSHINALDAEECMAQAEDALRACKNALRRLRRAGQ
jgi:hypothetical protein